MPTIWKIAGVQIDVSIGEPSKNLDAMLQYLDQTSAQGARLTVFPECALTGYCFESRPQALAFAETVPGPATQAIAERCQSLDVFCVFGLLESDGDQLFNACVLVGPDGLIGTYRKIHLPFLGVDRFTTPGDRPFGVHSAGDLRVGMHICYDGAFPEAARIMSLAGADLIVLPTNWPPGAECTADFVISARAMENHVYFMAVNRVGEERGFRFIGRSRICDVTGSPLAEAAHQEEAVLYAEIDTQSARNKRIVRVPNEHIIDRFRDRRPEMYGPLVEPVSGD